MPYTPTTLSGTIRKAIRQGLAMEIQYINLEGPTLLGWRIIQPMDVFLVSGQRYLLAFHLSGPSVSGATLGDYRVYILNNIVEYRLPEMLSEQKTIKKMDKIPTFTLKFDENEEISGVQTVSLVDAPAIESNFVALSSQKFQLKGDSYKQYVTGPVLIPDKEIIRFTEGGDPYNMIFSSELIEKLRNKFHKQKLTDKTNLEHDASQTKNDIYLIESWIVTDVDKDKSKNYELSDIKVGTWMATYHIPDKEVFEKVLSGELNGFSVEAFLTLDKLVMNSMNVEDKKIKNNMKKSKFESVISKVENFFASLEKVVLEDSEQKFEDYTLKDGKVVSVDEETKVATLDGEPAPVGEHELADGKILVIGEGSLFVEVKDAVAKPVTEEVMKAEPVKEVKASKISLKQAVEVINAYLAKSVYATYTLVDGSEVSLQVSEINEARVWNTESMMSEVLVDGTYELKEGGQLVIEGGKIKSAPDLVIQDEEVEVEVEAELSKPATIKVKDNKKKLKDDAPLWEKYAYNALKNKK